MEESNWWVQCKKDVAPLQHTFGKQTKEMFKNSSELHFSHIVPPPIYLMISIYSYIGKAIPVTGRGGLQGCGMLRIPHCLDNRLTNDGSKVVSLKHRLHFTPKEHFWYSFLLEAVSIYYSFSLSLSLSLSLTHTHTNTTVKLNFSLLTFGATPFFHWILQFS
jgi:hypothetical protein